MSGLLWGLALFLLLNLLAGFWRVSQGPGPADRMQAVLLSGTTLVAVLLLLAYAMAELVLVVVALIFALLAALGSLAFTALPVPDDDGGP